MVDPYAIVRRLTGHELISPKDARLLTEAVDGLINEIGSKDARIAELEAEVERLTGELDDAHMVKREAIAGWRDAEALSRTGAVKVKQIDWLAEWMHRHDLRLVNAAFDELLAHLSALTTEPAAPEGCRCQDCGKAYRTDLLVSADVWEKIKPEGKPVGGGLLCPTCIMDRASDLGIWTVAYAAAPEGRQEAVAWISVSDGPPEVGSKFVALYDDGSGAGLYFRHDGGYISAEGEEADVLSGVEAWAYLPAGFEFWCEGISEPVTLPKWSGHSALARPSEQAVTEARVEAGLRAAEKEAANFIFGGSTSFDAGFNEEAKERFRAIHRAALKAAMEAGRHALATSKGGER